MIVFLLIAISLAVALAPHVVYIILKGLSLVFSFEVTYRPYGIAAIVMVAMWLLLFVYGNKIGRFFHEFKTVSIPVAHLPQSFNGYKIVHISDLHLDGWAGHEEKLLSIVQEINAQKPDAIMFTGDLVSLKHEELEAFIPVLSQLKAKDGVFSIMGNHDYMPYNRSQSPRQQAANVALLQKMEREQLHWHLLINENATVKHGEDSIAIIGCENQSMGVHSIIQRGNITKAAQGTKGMAKIILTHDPTHWKGEILHHTSPADLDLEGALTLSGHTHSGQFRVLGFSVAKFIYKEYDGLYTEGSNNLYVNIGLGGTMPMRVGAVPEITVITIR